MRQRPGRSGGRSDGHAHSQTNPREPHPNILGQPVFPPEQMRDSADVEPKRIVAIDFDQRRPASRPARQPLEQRLVARRIGRDCNQAWIERSGIGQSRTGPRSTFGGGFCDRMDQKSVRAFDGKDDSAVRQ